MSEPSQQASDSANNKHPKVYQIVEYTGAEKLKPEQLELLVVQMQKYQQYVG
jgi:hypothetical protein